MAVLAFYHPFLLGFDVVLMLLVGFGIFRARSRGHRIVRGRVEEEVRRGRLAAGIGAAPTAFKLHAGQQFALQRADQLAVSYLEARRQHFRHPDATDRVCAWACKPSPRPCCWDWEAGW